MRAENDDFAIAILSDFCSYSLLPSWILPDEGCYTAKNSLIIAWPLVQLPTDVLTGKFVSYLLRYRCDPQELKPFSRQESSIDFVFLPLASLSNVAGYHIRPAKIIAFSCFFP
jgi:hypothetical protein